MNTTATEPDSSLCPVCGMSNSCTLADPRTVDQACWCFSQSIDPSVLEALPAELRNRACLCPRCAGVADSLQAKPLR